MAEIKMSGTLAERLPDGGWILSLDPDQGRATRGGPVILPLRVLEKGQYLRVRGGASISCTVNLGNFQVVRIHQLQIRR